MVVESPGTVLVLAYYKEYINDLEISHPIREDEWYW